MLLKEAFEQQRYVWGGGALAVGLLTLVLDEQDLAGRFLEGASASTASAATIPPPAYAAVLLLTGLILVMGLYRNRSSTWRKWLQPGSGIGRRAMTSPMSKQMTQPQAVRRLLSNFLKELALSGWAGADDSGAARQGAAGLCPPGLWRPRGPGAASWRAGNPDQAPPAWRSTRRHEIRLHLLDASQTESLWPPSTRLRAAAAGLVGSTS
jgi:hypothetical protein